MPLRDTTVARLGLVVLAIALWKHAAHLVFDGLLPRYPEAVVLLAITYVASFCALLVAASSSEKAARYARWAIVGFIIGAVVVTFRDGVRKASSEFLPTNDGHVFMDLAARYLLDGTNPYAKGLADAFRIYRMPMSYSTPLLDGDFSDRQAYPALSFIVLVPALLAHVPTYLVYAAAFIAAVVIVIQKAPWWARPIVAGAFMLEETYYSFAFGGVTDTVWVLFVIGAIVCWQKRPTWAAVLVGLACAYKQHPWFLVPLLLVRLGHDQGERPWGRASRRFLAVVAGVFVTINLPFVVWDARAWVAGIVEPLSAPMVQLSEGLTAFSMTGWISMPRAGTSVVFWSIYALALFAYARHTRVLRDWCWVVPGVVLWFGYRALMSYWYFFALTAVVAMFTAAESSRGEAEGEAVPRQPSWRPTGIAAATVAAGIAGFLLWCGTARPSPFGLSLAGTTEAWDLRAFALRVRVENRLEHEVLPQFSLQSNGLQPMPWVIDFGPRKLGAGQSAEYVIRGSRVFTEFDVTEGARLEVHDRREPGRRTFLSIAGERSIKLLDAVPNPAFHVIETRTRVPSGWSFDSTDAKLVIPNALDREERAVFDFAAAPVQAAAPSSFASCVVTQHIGEIADGARRATLSTVMPLPEGTLRFHVNVPPDANRTPFDALYGIVLTVRGFRVAVLLGEDVARGTLPSGETFTSLPVTRGRWTTVDIAPRAILERLQAPLYVSRYKYLRAPSLDFPSTPVEIGLLATTAPGSARTVQFGRIEQHELHPYEQLAKRPSEAGLAAWRAELDLENGNFAKAAKNLELATATEPSPDRLVRLGDAYLLDEHFAHARDTFARALTGGSVPDAEQGLGFSLLALGDLAGAKHHLELARDAFKDIEKDPPRWHYLNALRGLARTSAKQNDCESARRYRDEVVAETPGQPPPSIEGCP
jgi:hypothetical protein